MGIHTLDPNTLTDKLEKARAKEMIEDETKAHGEDQERLKGRALQAARKLGMSLPDFQKLVEKLANDPASETALIRCLQEYRAHNDTPGDKAAQALAAEEAKAIADAKAGATA